MMSKRFTEEQVACVLKAHEVSRTTKEICRRCGYLRLQVLIRAKGVAVNAKRT